MGEAAENQPTTDADALALYRSCQAHPSAKLIESGFQDACDRARDRDCQLSGTPILRFTGSESHRDPFAAAVQISKLCHSIGGERAIG